MEMNFHLVVGIGGRPGPVKNSAVTMFMAGIYSINFHAGIVNAPDISQERITADVIGT